MFRYISEQLCPDTNRKNINLDNLKGETKTDDHLIPLDELCRRYNVDPVRGHSSKQARELLEKNGFNRLTPPETTPEWVKFMHQLFGGFALLLWIGAILCITAYFINKNMDNLYLSIVLIFVVLFTSIFSYIQEARSNRIMDSFKKMIPPSAKVIRDGVSQNILAEELVVGDIIEFGGGDRVPADVRIIEATSCKVDNSSLTGESEPQLRVPGESNKIFIESPNIAFFSTNCVEGWAKAIVIYTGDHTLMGKIANLTANLQNNETPLSKEINHFIHIITWFAVVTASIFFIIAMAIGYKLIDALVFFIGIIVANVPEGLLATVTVCLTLTAKRMASKNCLVKNLEAVETLGSTSTICSDKTGTLTQNRMTVSHLWICHEIHDAENLLKQKCELSNFTDPFHLMYFVCSLCSKAYFKENQERIPVLKRIAIGDASESAILKFIEAVLSNSTVIGLRMDNPKVFEIPFNSTNKFHLMINKINTPESVYMISMKGAPERILERCSMYIHHKSIKLIDEKFKRDYDNAYMALGGMGERVLGMCCYKLPRSKFPEGYDFNAEKQNFPLKDFHFVGLISLIDPPKAGVRISVNKCREAGIKVIMVTGDHPITAKSIAKSVDIISANSKTRETSESNDWSSITSSLGPGPNSIVLTGVMITELGEKGLDEVIHHFDEIVFARTSPQQKLLIVEAFQRKGEIVAVTGDGVNDSPALKRADIGVSMGITGSDVSKQAADMILLDDNFCSIVVGIEEGRIIFDNLKKSIAYTLTSNVPEMVPFLVYITIGVPLPLGTITILCIDLGTDILPAIALGYEPAESDIMQRKPRTSLDRLVNSRLLQMAYCQIGFIQTGAGFLSYYVIMAQHGFFFRHLLGVRKAWEKDYGEVTDHFGQEWGPGARRRLQYTCQTAFFIAIVVTQWFDLIICKTRRNSIVQQGMRNEVVNFSLITETAITIFLCYTPGMNNMFKLHPITVKWWTFGIPFGVIIIVYDEIRRYFIRNYPGGFAERETYY